MFCQQCGTRNPNTARFCSACGQRIEMAEPAPGQRDAATGPAQGLEEDEAGIRPAPGWEWVNPDDPDDVSVRLKAGYVLDDDGRSIRPADGWAWVNPDDAQNFEIRQESTVGQDHLLAALQALNDAEPGSRLANAYATEDSNLAAWGGQELLRLELLMDYSEAFAAKSPDIVPVAAARWVVLSNKFKNDTSVREFKIILGAFLYAKALASDQLRSELFHVVGSALRNSLSSANVSAEKPLSRSELVFAPVFARSLLFTNIVWPWRTASWSEVERRLARAVTEQRTSPVAPFTLLTATLLVGPVEAAAPSGMWLRLRGAARLSKVFVPASALIAISRLWDDVPEGRGMLLSLLSNVNDYHETPDEVTVSEAFAMNAALEVLASRGERNVGEYRRRDRGARQVRTSGQQGTPGLDWAPLEKGLANALDSAFNWFRRK